VNYLDGEGKRFGNVSLQSPTISAFDANASKVLANTALATAMGGEAERDTYYCQLRCHDPSGDDYYVTFTRRTVRISSQRGRRHPDRSRELGRRRARAELRGDNSLFTFRPRTAPL